MKLLVSGKSGFGKSYYVQRRIKEIDKNYIIFTPYPEDYKDCGILINDYDSLKEYIVKNDRWRIVYPMNISQFRKNYVVLYNFCNFIFYQEKACLVCIDEIQNLRLDARKEISLKGELPVSLYRIIDEGRHYDIDIICVARRPVQFTPLLQSLADEIVTFRLTSNNDIKKLEEFFGDNAYKAAQLKKFHALRHVETEEFDKTILPNGTERNL